MDKEKQPERREPIKHGDFFAPIDKTIEAIRKREHEAWKSIAFFSNIPPLSEYADISAWIGKKISIKMRDTKKLIELEIAAVNKENGKIMFNNEKEEINEQLTADQFKKKYVIEKMDNTSEPTE